MRSYEQAHTSWQAFHEHRSLSTLRAALKDDHDIFASKGIRSACWKAFLICGHCETSKWPSTLQSSRAAYSDMRSRFMHGITHADELDSLDPLNDDANSPWNTLRKDEADRQEILQDVDRCMPDNHYFRQPSTQDMLLDILFVWAKLNPDVKYRQGMHEVLAPIVWAIERDAIAPETIPQDIVDSPMARTFDATFVEHDSFTLFNHVMQNIKSAYETTPIASGAVSSTGRPVSRSEPPMVVRGRRILERDLAKLDPALSRHLIKLEIIPQIFLLRWIRLLFGREFPFDEVLTLWDSMFAEDPSLECVDLVCVSMLLRIRWHLLAADYNSALTMVLRYPALPTSQGPSTLVGDALYLRTHFTSTGGAHVIGRATGRPPEPDEANTNDDTNEEWAASLPQRNSSANSAERKAPGNLEGIVQDAARSLIARGEKWGVGKAVRDAVGEVRKNVNQLQAQAKHSRNVSRSTATSGADQSEALVKRLGDLEARNKSLAKMLEKTVEDLWDHHKGVSEGTAQGADRTEVLTMAIAKAQLVQVYLEDSSIPLGLLDDPEKDPECVSSPSQGLSPSRQNDETRANVGEEQPLVNPSTPQKQQQTRPALHESPFSWMLGQEEKGMMSPRSAFISASPFSAKDAPSNRASDSLFGDPLDDVPFRGKASQGAKSKSKSKSKVESIAPEEDVFDLGSFQPK